MFKGWFYLFDVLTKLANSTFVQHIWVFGDSDKGTIRVLYNDDTKVEPIREYLQKNATENDHDIYNVCGCKVSLVNAH